MKKSHSNLDSRVSNHESSGAAAPPVSSGVLAELLRKPGVKLWLANQLAKSNLELRLGPGGTWDYGNESKRQDIADLNAALRVLSKIVTG